MGRAGLWKYEKVDGSFWHSIADRDGLGTRIQFTKYAKVWNVFVHFTVLLTTLIGVLSLQTSPPYNCGGGNPLSPVSTPHRGLLFGSGSQQESLAELNMGLSGPGQLELKSSSPCPMDSLFCVRSRTAVILNPPSNICKAGVTCCWHTNAFPWEREGWLNWFWKPFCVGKNTCSLQTLHLGFLCLFSSYCFFEPKIKMQQLDDGFGKMPCLFWWVSSVKACLMWCISRYQGLKRTRVLLVLPPLPGWKRQALFIWWCLAYSASDSRKVQDAFGISLFGFESCVKIQNSESTRPSCIILILCCNFI